MFGLLKEFNKEWEGFAVGVGATKMSGCFQEWLDFTRFFLPDSDLEKSAFRFEFSSSTFWFARVRSKEPAEGAFIFINVFRMLIDTEKGVSSILKLSPDFFMIERTESHVDTGSILGYYICYSELILNLLVN